AQVRDSLEDLRRSAAAEARQRRQPAALRGRLEPVHRRDAESLVNGLDLRGAEAGNAQHLDQPVGSFGAQLLEVARLAALHELADGRERGWPDPLERRELARSERGAEIVRLHAERG